MMNKRWITTSLVIGAVVTVGQACLAQHAGDLWIGRTSGGQLAIDTVCNPSCGFKPAGASEILLTPDDFGGWSNDDPGFDSINADQPAPEDLLMLQPGADIYLRIEADPPQPDPALEDLLISPALLIYDPVQFTFFPYEDQGVVVREVHIGNHNLHKHFIWFIDALDPRFGEAGCDYQVTFRLIDKGMTGYTDSEPITLRFAFPRAVADLNCDTDVDGDDFALFGGCMTGPMVPYDSEDLPETCLLEPDENGILPADLDGDGDVDGVDFAVYQRCYSGEGVAADVACG